MLNGGLFPLIILIYNALKILERGTLIRQYKESKRRGMPRTARLDAPGVLHHIMIRGIERRKIFRNNKDRENFLDRLEKLLPYT